MPDTVAAMEPHADSDAAPADEWLLLGLIAGCCNLVPRDEGKLAVLLDQLRMAQQRRAGSATPGHDNDSGD